MLLKSQGGIPFEFECRTTRNCSSTKLHRKLTVCFYETRISLHIYFDSKSPIRSDSCGSRLFFSANSAPLYRFLDVGFRVHYNR